MDSQTQEIDELRTRLEALERLHGRLKRLGLSACALLGLGLLAAAACNGSDGAADSGAQTAALPAQASFEAVEARSFILRNDDGEVAARLEMNTQLQGPQLVLYAKPDLPSIELRTTPFDSTLFLNANGKPRVQVDASVHAELARFTFWSDNQQVLLQGATEFGLSNFYLHGPPNEKGIKSNVGIYMSPEGWPKISMRTDDLKEKVWDMAE